MTPGWSPEARFLVLKPREARLDESQHGTGPEACVPFSVNKGTLVAALLLFHPHLGNRCCVCLMSQVHGAGEGTQSSSEVVMPRGPRCSSNLQNQVPLESTKPARKFLLAVTENAAMQPGTGRSHAGSWVPVTLCPCLLWGEFRHRPLSSWRQRGGQARF